MTEDETEQKTPSYGELAAELGSAYGLLLQALPLALTMLKTGTVPLRDQRWFWQEIEFVERFVHLFSDTNELQLEEDEIVERRDFMDTLGARHGVNRKDT